jgi:cysteinyl-tRNA synthetase
LLLYFCPKGSRKPRKKKIMLKIYDSTDKTLKEFIPLNPDAVGLYYCGATVQGAPHIGHIRSALSFDVIRRWLTHHGYAVEVIRNVTDIDDKILQKSKASFGSSFVAGGDYLPEEKWQALAYRFENRFRDDYRTLNIIPPTYEPRVTGNIPEIKVFIADLLSKGYAYAPGNGDVYFDNVAFSGAPGEIRPGDEVNYYKKDVSDFALWKAAKGDEPADASWDSPWGRGRPGWHIECSALALKYLGSEFDIHGGGTDLAVPHHANEKAQSHAVGHGFAKYWMHNGSVTVNGEKMSKSIGNTVSLATMLSHDGLRPDEARYYLLSTHYRSSLDYSTLAAQGAARGYRRILEFIRDAKGSLSSSPLPQRFSTAMDEDFNTVAAFAELHALVKTGQNLLRDEAFEDARGIADSLVTALDVLGLGWEMEDTEELGVNELVERLSELRELLRKEKNFAASDAIRNIMMETGFEVKDKNLR